MQILTRKKDQAEKYKIVTMNKYNGTIIFLTKGQVSCYGALPTMAKNQ